MAGKRKKWSIFTACLVWVGLAGMTRESPSAQPEPRNEQAANKIYTNNPAFYVPVRIPAQVLPSLREIQLFVKRDRDPSWSLWEKSLPTKKEFKYHGFQDGEYWFRVVKVDEKGNPANPGQSPELIIVLDREAPKLKLQQSTLPDAELAVLCEMVDPHADPQGVRLEYQIANGSWREMKRHPQSWKTFSVPSQAGATGRIRATAMDLAGNVTTQEFNAQVHKLSTVVENPGNLSLGTHGSEPSPAPKMATGKPGPSTPPAEIMTLGQQNKLEEKGQTFPPRPPNLLPAQIVKSPLPLDDPVPAPGPQGPAQVVVPAHLVQQIQENRVLEKTSPASFSRKTEEFIQLPPRVDEEVLLRSSPPRSKLDSSPSAPLKTKNSPPEIPGPKGGAEKSTLPAAAPLDEAALLRSSPQRSKAVSSTAPQVPLVKPVSRQLVRSARLVMNYQIEQQGLSGVGRVEVWITSDQAKTWKKLCEDPDRKSPIEFDLPGEGLFGIKLVVANGRGFGGGSPAPGEAPDSWIEVDGTEPRAELRGLRPGSGEDHGLFFIYWNAVDKNLGPEPIDLYYATQREGPWLSLARGLKNDGLYRWPVPRDLGAHVYIRMVVTDQAGNSTRCESPQVVLDDLSRPRARVTDIAIRSGGKK